MHRISKTNLSYEMNKDTKPVLELALPASMTFETLDAFGEQIQSEADLIDALDFDKVNPATGSVYFKSASPGDVLAVKIEAIRVADIGCMTCTPGYGILKDQYKKSETLMIPIEGDTFLFKDLRLPLNPMIGVIGLAPAGEAVNCGTPGDHGGNMDSTLIHAGATLYLPVFAEGGLLSMGDLHAAMGDGEACVTGVEVSGEVDVTVSKTEGLNIAMPLVMADGKIAFIGSKSTMDEAIYYVTDAMAKLLVENSSLSFNEATMLMSAAGNVEISQMVDPQVSARFSIPLAVIVQLGMMDLFS